MLMPSLDFLFSNSDNSFSNPTVSLEIAPPLYTNKGSLVYVAAVKLQDGAEGASPTSGKIRVKLSQPDGSDLADSTEWLDQDLSISFAVTNSPGCVPGVDYSNTLVDPTAGLGSVTIPRGSQYADIVIPVFDDTEVEATETISIQLEAGTGFQLSTTPSAAVSILDDEPVLTVRKVADATESGTLGSFVVDIASSLPRRLDFTFTLGGTAVEGTDYATITHAGSISAGETPSVPISIAAIRDADYDNNETVTIDIVASPTVYTLGATQSASLYIVDDIGW